MKTKYVSLFVLIALSGAATVHAQQIETKGRITSSIYAYVPPSLRGSEDQETTWYFYQYLRFEARVREYNNLTLHYNTRILTNTRDDIPNDLRFRVNRLSLSAQDLFSGFMDLEAGRFFFHPGIVFGSLDGLNLVLKPGTAWHIQLFGGVESTLERTYKVYKLDDAKVFGGALKYFNLAGTDLQLAYLQKMHKEETAWQLVALNLSNYTFSDWKFLLQAHYDIANERLHRFYFSTRWKAFRKLSLDLHLKQQHPQIYADSYYTIFDLYNYQQAGLGANWFFSDEYSLTVNFQYFKLEEEGSGQRVLVAVNDYNGSVGVAYETGDLGDQLGLMVSYGYEFLPGLIASLSVDYQRYRVDELYDYENQIGNALRLTYSFAGHWKVAAEYQLLNNHISSTDQRFLNHIHYIW